MLGGAGESLALQAKTDDLQLQQWVVERLLPWAYWHQQADKTRQKLLKLVYQAAAEPGKDRLGADPLTRQLEADTLPEWVEWANWIALKYQRTTSAVEGRNGYLSRLHHSSRGFSASKRCSLESTILTSGERMVLRQHNDSLDTMHENLFEWVVDHMGELPGPRQSSSIQPSHPLPRLAVPA